MNPEASPIGPKVLVAEEDYLQASAMARSLEAAGARVAGPVATLAAALRMLEREADIAGAVLDLELHGEQVFPLAAILQRKGLPFVFASARPTAGLPSAFRDAHWLPKPASMEQAMALLGVNETSSRMIAMDVTVRNLLAA
ncbi:response regulator [Sabulicella glaciei]|uniref:Response regulator n=1 Tax=Sabulicella glaciei TaxID=2984948 RepID=A0ABT3P272_9PROT|nr:response regulator [Roseococcus sp. MDT2-1-1]MCW8088514.1 response regulator [Roseococcus sp. MDT2-1-1]